MLATCVHFLLPASSPSVPSHRFHSFPRIVFICPLASFSFLPSHLCYSLALSLKTGVPHTTYIGLPQSYGIGVGHSP